MIVSIENYDVRVATDVLLCSTVDEARSSTFEPLSCIQHKIFFCQLANKSKVAGKIRETVVIACCGWERAWREKKFN